MDMKPYEDVLTFVKRAKDAGVDLVLVYEPSQAGADDRDEPNMIVSSSDDAEVIAALLGNRADSGSTADDNA